MCLANEKAKPRIARISRIDTRINRVIGGYRFSNVRSSRTGTLIRANTVAQLMTSGEVIFAVFTGVMLDRNTEHINLELAYSRGRVGGTSIEFEAESRRLDGARRRSGRLISDLELQHRMAEAFGYVHQPVHYA